MIWPSTPVDNAMAKTSGINGAKHVSTCGGGGMEGVKREGVWIEK